MVGPLPWNRWLFGRGTDGMMCVSPETARRCEVSRRGRPIAGAFGAVASAPEPKWESRKALRESLGIPGDAPVIGIVARMPSPT